MVSPKLIAFAVVAALAAALAGILVYVGLPFWAAILIAIGAVVFNGWLLELEDRERGL